ncbi:MAG: SpoIIE family protein phosphatase [Firmicutes bacterium]|nr:SpoIIE family protein phosphatase [Bacillota bacterium]
MPAKSVREMTRIERLRHSLGARTFQAVLILSILIGVLVEAFGITLYAHTAKNEYTQAAEHLADTAGSVMQYEEQAVYEYARKIVQRYTDAGSELQADPASAAYRLQFQEFLDDETWLEVNTLLKRLSDSNEADAVYVAALDEDALRFVYIFDSQGPDSPELPGDWDPLMKAELTRYLEGLEEPVSYLGRTAEYGVQSTGARYLFEVNGMKVFAFADINLNHVMRRSLRFLWQFGLLLAVLVIAGSRLLANRLQKEVVDPINRLSDAAAQYVEDKRKGRQEADHFAKLGIATGDEIENLSLIMADMESDLTTYIEDLTRVTGEKERIGAELNIARKIQEGSLPGTFPPFPDRTEFDLYASMHAAKEVGGDFYDFFLIDDDHLALVMADVSGKGVPAALFMMASKMLISNYAAIEKDSPAKILTRVNERICAGNTAGMFVTVWLGILEISTGVLKAANAGHEYPILRKAGQPFALLKDKHGFVVGGMEGVRYKEYEIAMEKGDQLFLYTDGVAEANDRDENMFGIDRTLTALNGVELPYCKNEVDAVSDAVHAFMGKAEQFDDITMLCLNYYGKETPMTEEKSLTIDAKVDRLHDVLDFIDAYLEEQDCPPKAQMQLDLAVEELFVNIASYAYPDGGGTAEIRIRTFGEPKRAEIVLRDSGIPYDPTKNEDPDITMAAEDRDIGGLGVFMVKKYTDSVQYAYEDGHNVLTITKTIE